MRHWLGRVVYSDMDDAHVQLILSKFDEVNRRQDLLAQQMAEDRRESAESRRRVYEKVDDIKHHVSAVSGKVERLESSVASMSPAVTEFVTLKAQAKGAGRLGSSLWWAGGVLLTLAGGLVASWAHVASWLRPPPSP